MAVQQARVPVLDETGRFPDAYAPPSVATNTAAAQEAREGAETARTGAVTAQGKAEEAQQGAEDALAALTTTAGVAFKSDFSDSGDGLYTFPTDTPYPAVVAGVAASAYSPGSTLDGQSVSTGSGSISIRPIVSPAGVWAVTSDGTQMRCTAGQEDVNRIGLAVNVGDGKYGVSRAVLGTLNPVGSEQGVGAFLRGALSVPAYNAYGWSLSPTNRTYQLERAGGDSLPLTMTSLATSDVVAQDGDVVELWLRESDNMLLLIVNGAQVLTRQLTNPQPGSLAGVWGLPGGSGVVQWEWSTTPIPTNDRLMVTVDSTTKQPGAWMTISERLLPSSRLFPTSYYGAHMDAVYLRDAAMTAESADLSSSSYTFVSGDVGKTVAVMGAGPVVANGNDGVLISTISSVASGVATLKKTATTTVSGARCVFGTPDDQAFADARDAAAAAGGGTVLIPAGRCIVTVPHIVKNYVSYAGAGRDTSWVHIVADIAGSSTSGVGDWLTCSGFTSANPYDGGYFHDFGIEAEAMIRTNGYNTGLKPLNIFNCRRTSVERINIWNSPATAIPFDGAQDQCWIKDNFIVNPGRLAPVGVGPGGSGIGAGTKGLDSVEPTLIEGNVIIGTHTGTAAGLGHNGIFVEAQSGVPAGAPGGYRIVNNVIIGMPWGISDAGSGGTLIQGNRVVKCGVGIAVRRTKLGSSYPGVNTIIANNYVTMSVGPESWQGIGILITTTGGTNTSPLLHSIITSNTVTRSSKNGIVFQIPPGGTSMTGVRATGNAITRSGLSGILITGLESEQQFNHLAVTGNTLSGNGTSTSSGHQFGIEITDATTLVGGRIQDNDIFDTVSTPTQTGTVKTSGATLIEVTVSGNTGD